MAVARAGVFVYDKIWTTPVPQSAATLGGGDEGCGVAVRVHIERKFSDKLPRRSSFGDSCPGAK